MPRTTVASGDDDFRKWIGLGLAGFTIYRVVSGRKVDPLSALTSALTIIAFFFRDL